MKVFALAAALFTALAAAKSASSSSSTISPGAVVSTVVPKTPAPSGCSPSYDGTFEIGPVNVTNSSSTRRDLHGRDTTLGIALKDGVLTDPYGRTGYIASNQQFQFDKPPQAGAIYTGGFSICPNGSLALGSDVFWYSCLSGSFSNLYYKSVGAQCVLSYIITYPVDGGHPYPVSVTPSNSSTTAIASSSASSNSTMTAIGGHHSSTKTAKSTAKMTSTSSKSKASAASTASSAASSATSSAGAIQSSTPQGAMMGLVGGLFALAMI